MSSSQRNIITGHNMKIIITESKLEKVAIKWLNDNYGDLIPFETKKHRNSIFYIKGDKAVFEYKKENGFIYISDSEIWSFLQNMFSMEYEQIQDLTKEWVEEHYKLKVRKTLKVGYGSGPIAWGNITN